MSWDLISGVSRNVAGRPLSVFVPHETGLLACLCIFIVDKDCKGILDIKKAGAFSARMRITEQKT